MRDELVLNNLNLIYLILRRMGLYDKRDYYYDICVIGLVKAANDFDKDMGFKFSAIATKYIETEILKDIRRNKSDKRKANNNAISLDSVRYQNKGDDAEILLIDTIPSDFNVEEYILKKERLELLCKAISELSDKEKELLKDYFFDDMRQVDIAKKLNVTQAAISRRIIILIEKLKKKVVFNERS